MFFFILILTYCACTLTCLLKALAAQTLHNARVSFCELCNAHRPYLAKTDSAASVVINAPLG